MKICGVTRPQDLGVVAAAGVAYVGFNFFPRSPRYVTPEAARMLSFETAAGIAKVGLTVDASDSELDGIVESVPLDMLQFHGSETPDRLARLRERYGLPVMKAVGVAGEEDLPALAEYGRVVDQLLVDAKPAEGADLPGGNGLAFDWRLIAGRRWPVPWMLAGGLTSNNVAEAIRLTGARQVDVSSGVESAPGIKDAGMISAFAAAALA